MSDYNRPSSKALQIVSPKFQPIWRPECPTRLRRFMNSGEFFLKFQTWDFPGGPEAKTPHSQCRVPGVNTFHMPPVRDGTLQLKILHATAKTQHSQIRK